MKLCRFWRQPSMKCSYRATTESFAFFPLCKKTALSPSVWPPPTAASSAPPTTRAPSQSRLNVLMAGNYRLRRKIQTERSPLPTGTAFPFQALLKKAYIACRRQRAILFALPQKIVRKLKSQKIMTKTGT